MSVPTVYQVKYYNFGKSHWQIPQQNRSKTFYEIALVSVLIAPTMKIIRLGFKTKEKFLLFRNYAIKNGRSFKKRRKICFSRKKINTGIMQGLLIGAVDNQSSFKYQVLYHPFHGLLTNQKWILSLLCISQLIFM